MLGELIEWTQNLDPGFAFLLALPFVVAIAGFVAHVVETRRTGYKPATQRRPSIADRPLWSRGL
jgi:hypothetical protein